MLKKEIPKVSIVIPVYKPDEKIFAKVKDMIKNQTVKSEIVEMWNNPEAVSMNKGIVAAKSDIVVILAQDCVPRGKKWLENLIKPLENPKIVVSTSYLNLPEEFWKKKYKFLTRMLTINEIKFAKPIMDARACAFRKKDLIKVGLFNEDPKCIAIDADIFIKLKKLGKVVRPDAVVDHLHLLTNERKLKMIYNYAEANGKLVKIYGKNIHSFWLRIIRAFPFFGILPMLYVFPYDKYLKYFPIYLLFIPIQHLFGLYGFWKGFLFNKESMRNKEVLQEKIKSHLDNNTA